MFWEGSQYTFVFRFLSIWQTSDLNHGLDKIELFSAMSFGSKSFKFWVMDWYFKTSFPWVCGPKRIKRKNEQVDKWKPFQHFNILVEEEGPVLELRFWEQRKRKVEFSSSHTSQLLLSSQKYEANTNYSSYRNRLSIFRQIHKNKKGDV